jgi:iron-sulfur cluster assembly protein
MRAASAGCWSTTALDGRSRTTCSPDASQESARATSTSSFNSGPAFRLLSTSVPPCAGDVKLATRSFTASGTVRRVSAAHTVVSRRPTASVGRVSPPESSTKGVSALLELTDGAAQAVKTIVSSSDELPETGGLRLVAQRAGHRPTSTSASYRLPAEDDEVIEEQGARVFLEPEAASLLDDKILDASVEQNQATFAIADQLEE